MGVLEQLYREIPGVSPDARLSEVAEVLLKTESNLVVVGEEGEEPRGFINCKMIIEALLHKKSGGWDIKAADIAEKITERAKVDVTGSEESIFRHLSKYDRVPLFASKDGKITGTFSHGAIIKELASVNIEERYKRMDIERMGDIILDLMPIGVVLVSEDGEIKKVNRIAKEIMEENQINAEILKGVITSNYQETIVTGKKKYYKVFAKNVDIDIAGLDPVIMVVFLDVTSEYNLVDKFEEAREEAETALGVMLPDQRLEARLKSIVEYTDRYDSKTGMIEITGVIEGGTYRHVINMLKLVADAFRQGLMELPGMDKNTIVSAVVLHDFAKVQPQLKVGDMVKPDEVFEKGYLHAFRSASIAKGVYNVSDDVYYLIKYHHHREEELPDSFPEYLLPMYRFFRLIDGLSAGITRRDSKVTMEIKGSLVYVKEESNFPLYNRTLELDIYSGRCSIQKL